MEGRKVAVIPISNLAPGMIAAADIYSRNEQLLIPKGSVIDESGIARITFFGILSVSVYLESEEQARSLDGELSEKPTKEEVIRQFEKEYDHSIVTVTHTMNQLLEKGADIDEEKLVKDITKIVSITDNKLELFNMLNYLKDFDDETYTHSINVAMICNVFADWLEMSEYEKKVLTLCGILHDFGKLLINKEVLKKPGKLTDDEFKIIKEHPLRGYEFLKDKNLNKSIKKAVLLHHERCNGKGYPLGVRVNEIDPFAAITAIADVYEAMTANRCYRKGICPFEVIRLFEEEGRQQFNPIFLVPIMRKLTDAYLQHEVILSDGRVGRIVLNNPSELSRPSILTDTGIIDLSKNRSIVISQVL